MDIRQVVKHIAESHILRMFAYLKKTQETGIPPRGAPPVTGKGAKAWGLLPED